MSAWLTEGKLLVEDLGTIHCPVLECSTTYAASTASQCCNSLFDCNSESILVLMLTFLEHLRIGIEYIYTEPPSAKPTETKLTCQPEEQTYHGKRSVFLEPVDP